MSIKKYYPTSKVLVVDDSKTAPPTMDGVKYMFLPFDSGVSAKRNAAVAAVDTEYVFLLEDDCFFNEKTDLLELLKLLNVSGCDIIGPKASGVDYSGIYTWDGPTRTVRCFRDPLDIAEGNVPLFEFIPNIFLAKTSVLKSHPWDEELKIGEHFAFFWKYRGQLKIGFTHAVSITHGHYETPGYASYRHRAVEYVKKFMRENGIIRRVDFHSDISVTL